MDDSFIEELRQQISHNLPGEKAHELMLPMGRTTGLSQIQDFSKVRKSAVAFTLFHDTSWKSLLIQRPHYQGYHSGQVCLPGGSQDKMDQALLHTALRECEEETGIKQKQLQQIGQLTPVYIPVSNFLVQPFVFYLDRHPVFYPDEREVEELLVFDIDKELRRLEVRYKDIPITENQSLKDVPYFPIKNKVVWGATALILSEMKEVLKNIIKD
jgi:8-oxo-dGTP pyrophosphatase MutT (NUDIX family)